MTFAMFVFIVSKYAICKQLFRPETSFSKSKLDDAQAACLEDAVSQCEILFQEKEKVKAQLDDVVFQALEKDKQLDEM